ncbi:fatty acid synthase beta subunit dehydratase [Xylogone sp. PMI_703]|nr:fatty acid synthase beta subunit dehydratase [Xylogone sp. PMI_703]
MGLNSRGPGSALFGAAENGRAALVALFGGQGNTEDYFSELRGIYETYPGLSEELLSKASKVLLSLVQDVKNNGHDLYPEGLDIMAWLRDPESTPAAEYMLAAPLLLFSVTCQRLAFTPGQFCQRFAGTSGHSQGVVVAAAIATAHDWESFYDAAIVALQILFWIGYRTQQGFPKEALLPSVVADSIEHGEGSPTPMMSISDLPLPKVEEAINEINQHLPENRHMVVALINGPRNIVVSGHPSSLHGLAIKLRAKNVPSSQDQTKIPYSRRKQSFQLRYLPISVPFHSEYLLGATFMIEEDLKNVRLDRKDLKIPVYITRTGGDLRTSTEEDLIPTLVRLVTLEQVDWPRVINFPPATHIIDFGPGGSSGAGTLTHKIKDGTGVRVLLAGPATGQSTDLGYQPEIFDQDEEVKFGVNWYQKFKPGLVRTAAGVTYIDTKMSRLLGLPPLMVAGMTPCTVPWDFVAATMNAGYHIELAGGGYYNAKGMTDAMVKIQNAVEPGREICVNLIYASSASMHWQIPLIRDLQAGSTGVSVAGLTIGAGVPSNEVASTYIETLGLKYIAFKPGGVSTIQRVIQIARAHPDFPILLQWTGGRGDFHEPILQTYSAIRNGFGGSEDTYPYLNGSWSEMLGYASMPFDGCLLGSPHTAIAAKAAIVAAKGKTYNGPAGGIITVKSEMATRGVLLWAELDKTVFSLDKNKRVAELKKRRDYIIKRLNADFQKPWFGQADCKAVDLEDMTYGQISRWIDPTYKKLVFDFLRRSSLLADPTDLDEEPKDTIDNILAQLINGEDVQYFLQLCQRRGQKPVTFIPVLDENFETWFKKDSLWQSEDLAAVVDQDIGRTCIIQGPVAPVKDILDGINRDHIRFLTEELYNGRSGAIPTREYFFGNDVHDIPSRDQYTSVERDDGTTVYSLPLTSTQPLPSATSWLRLLAGPSRSCRHALFMSERIIQDVWQRNPFRRVFSPRRGIQVEINDASAGAWTTIRLNEETGPNRFEPALEIRMSPSNKISVNVIARKTASGAPAILRLAYTYHPEAGYAPIREIMEYRNDRINEFYYGCWFGDERAPSRNCHDKGVEYEATNINRQDVEAFMRATKNNRGSNDPDLMPMSYAIKLAWKPIMKALFSKAVRGDLLKLVHLSNTYTITPGGPKIKVGQTVDVSADIAAILNQESGKVVSVLATVKVDGKSAMTITSRFFYRGKFSDFENTVEKKVEEPRQLALKSPVDVAVLKSKSWLHLDDPDVDLLGLQLVFRLESTARYKTASVYSSIDISGPITIEGPSQAPIRIGSVEFNCGISHGNEVLDYLDRNGTIIQQPIELAHLIPLHGAEPISARAPTSNAPYAAASGDFNPIHVSPVFMAYANLPGTITHGMFISSLMQGLVETYAADNEAERVKSFHASFVGMVLPEDELEVELFHTAMIDGCRIIKIEAKNKLTEEKVFSGEARVGPPVTVYMFAGQGSQEVGMGMELYETSAAAREVWDRADKYLSDTFGFLITDIVRKNPKELTVHFRGHRGRAMRENYMKLTHDVHDANGDLRTKKLFPQIDEFTTSYTYRSPTGLLFSTQFTQPALTIAEKASIDDMKSKGLISNESIFAGHSLGEYSALAALADIVPIERLISIVFYRGLTMQHALERDSDGRSNFAMVAVDPSRIHPSFTEAALRYVVGSICRVTGEFLEIVNFNVEGKQYVCTGSLQALDCLMVLTNTLKSRNIDLPTFMSIMPQAQLNETFDTVVQECSAVVAAKPKPLTLQRGSATIPLPGLDVPFHSSYFVPRLQSFRHALLENLDEKSIRPEKLIGKYVPNLTAKPFRIDKDYFEEVYELTGSERIKAVLDNWEQGEATGKSLLYAYE